MSNKVIGSIIGAASVLVLSIVGIFVIRNKPANKRERYNKKINKLNAKLAATPTAPVVAAPVVAAPVVAAPVVPPAVKKAAKKAAKKAKSKKEVVESPAAVAAEKAKKALAAA